MLKAKLKQRRIGRAAPQAAPPFIVLTTFRRSHWRRLRAIPPLPIASLVLAESHQIVVNRTKSHQKNKKFQFQTMKYQGLSFGIQHLAFGIFFASSKKRNIFEKKPKMAFSVRLGESPGQGSANTWRACAKSLARMEAPPHHIDESRNSGLLPGPFAAKYRLFQLISAYSRISGIGLGALQNGQISFRTRNEAEQIGIASERFSDDIWPLRYWVLCECLDHPFL